jgi:hypothetical protein
LACLGGTMDALISDMRFAIRSLAKAKLFTIVALT